jgi:autotransporter-associated beta strand protein
VVVIKSSKGLRLCAGLLLAAFIGSTPAWSQTWNVYQPYTNSFFIPFVGAQKTTPDTFRYIDLTLNYGNSTKTNQFVMDTGSTGITASGDYYQPNTNTDTFMGPGSITYTSSNKIESGKIYLTNVIIHGQGGQTITSEVPILQVLNECPTTNPQCGFVPSGVAYMGVGFGRGGFQSTVPLGNVNPFLGLTGPLASSMRAGYIITNSGSTPGVTLGLTNQNTAGFGSFIKLSPNGATAGCTAPVPSCYYDWTATTASVSVNNQNTGTGSILPDSGIVYMILVTPVASTLPTGGTCPPSAVGSNCAPNGTTVQVSLPGLGNGALYQFTVGGSGNPSQPSAVEYFGGSAMSVNTGVGFYGSIDYLYDAAGGYVGYRWNNAAGSSGFVLPLLALQGNVAFNSGFMTDFPVLLMPGTTTLSGPSNGAGFFMGNVFGPGALTVGSGNFWLMGQNNTYTGGTTVNGGSLTLGPGASLPFGGALTINGGAFNLNGNTQVLGSLAGSGGTLAMGNGMLILNTATANTFGSSITGNGMLILQGGGSLNLTGASSFSGATVVSNSTLAVNGSLGGKVFVGNTGTLSGNGFIGGSVFNAGTLAPGNLGGTLGIGGNYMQAAGSSYQVQVNNTGQSDLVAINGAAALQGGTVAVSAPAGIYAPRTRYTILSAAGGVSGAYAGVTGINYAFLQPSLSYDANNAYLNLQIGGFQQAAQTPNQAAVGAALDVGAPNATGDFATVLGNLATLSASQVLPFLTSISGQNYSGFSNSMVQGAQLFMNNFATQAGGQGAGGATGSRVALAEACDVACDTTSPAVWGAWGGALGGLGTVGAGLGTGTVTYNLGGFATGLDRQVTPTLRAGVTVGYTTGTQWVGGFTGQGFSNTVAAGLYGNYSEGKVYLDGLASYAYSANQMSRGIAVPNLQSRTAQGQTGANQVFGQLEGGYRFDLGGPVDAFVTPFARLQGYTGTQNAFSEFGAQSLDLNVAAQTTSSLRSVLGAQLGGSVDVGLREKLLAQFRLGWSHEYADTNRPVSAALAGAPTVPFTTYGASPQRDGAVVGVSVNTVVADATSLYLRYEGDFSGLDSTHALTAGVRITW